MYRRKNSPRGAWREARRVGGFLVLENKAEFKALCLSEREVSALFDRYELEGTRGEK